MLFSAIQAKLLPEPSDVEVKCPPLAVKFLRAHDVQFLVSLGWVGSGWCSDHCQDPNRVPSSAFPHSVSLWSLAERVRLAPQAWQGWALTQPWCAQISRTSWGLRWATPPPWMSSSVLWTTFCVCRWVGAGRWHALCTLLEAKDSYRRPGTTEDTVQPECRRCCKPCAHTHGKSNT